MKKIIIISTIAIAIICIVVYFDSIRYYPEKFKIKDVQVALLSVVGKDSASDCYKLIDATKLDDSTHQILLAIRFKLDYFSLKHEHFWNTPKAPPGAFGHTDTINSISIIDKHSNSIDQNDLKSASDYTEFKKDNVVSQLGGFHHTGKIGCFSAQTFNSLNEFIESYNNNDPLETQQSLYMCDYHFFKISYKTAQQIKKYGSRFSVKFKDGTIIETPVRY